MTKHYLEVSLQEKSKNNNDPSNILDNHIAILYEKKNILNNSIRLLNNKNTLIKNIKEIMNKLDDIYYDDNENEKDKMI